MRRRLGAAVVVLGVTALAVAGARGDGERGPLVTAQAAETVTWPEGAAGPLTCAPRKRWFRTLPSMQPTPYCLALREGAMDRRDGILLTPRPDPQVDAGEQFGLMLFSGTGELLWYLPRPAKVHDLKQVTYRGEPMLAFFERSPSGGHHQLLDSSYRPVARIQAGGGLRTDEHDMQLTPHGTAYLASDERIHMPGVGRIVDYIVQEVDIASGEVLFEWRASENVPVEDSYMQRPPPDELWDFFHGNSIEPPTKEDPTIIVSGRNTSALYGIDRRTGRTSWIMGGKRDQFNLASRPRNVFCTQHDARRLGDGELMLFDNGGSAIRGLPRCPVHPARALVMRVDVPRRRAHVLRSISSRAVSDSGRGFRSGWVGSARRQPDGDTLIAWGSEPRVDVVGPDGAGDLAVRTAYWSYRAAPARWVGRPPTAPAALASRDGDEVTIWAAWNGATEIHHWQVLAGSSPQSVRPLGEPVPFVDLETRITARTDAPYVAVRALDADGRTLGESDAALAD